MDKYGKIGPLEVERTNTNAVNDITTSMHAKHKISTNDVKCSNNMLERWKSSTNSCKNKEMGRWYL